MAQRGELIGQAHMQKFQNSNSDQQILLQLLFLNILVLTFIGHEQGL
jgi:hypothetical protein